MPIKDLPNELLVEIARDLLDLEEDWEDIPTSRARALQNLTCVCAQFRSLLTNSPELWNDIDLRWNPSAIDTFLARSACCPVRVELRPHKTLLCHQKENGLSCIIGSSERIDLEFYDLSEEQLAGTWMAGLKTIAAPQLHTLVLVLRRPELQISIDSSILHPYSCMHLTELQLLGYSVSQFPLLPVLRYLKLSWTSYSLEGFHKLLTNSPLLETINLTKSYIMQPVDELYTCQRAPLLHLRRLKMCDYITPIIALLAIVPNPSHELKIEPAGDVSFGTDIAPISSRVLQFVEATQGAILRGRLCVIIENGSRVTSHVYFGGSHDVTPSLTYEMPCSLETGPLSQHITTLHLYHQAGQLRLPCICSDLLPLHNLPNIKVLQIYGFPCTYQTKEGRVWLQSLENWIRSFNNKGRSLRSVEFSKCSKAFKILRCRLEGDQVVGSIVWKRV